MTNDLSNFAKWWSDALFVSFLIYYSCINESAKTWSREIPMFLYVPAGLSLFAPMINRRANTNIHKKSSSRPKPAIAHCSEISESEEISLLIYFSKSVQLFFLSWNKETQYCPYCNNMQARRNICHTEGICTEILLNRSPVFPTWILFAVKFGRNWNVNSKFFEILIVSQGQNFKKKKENGQNRFCQKGPNDVQFFNCFLPQGIWHQPLPETKSDTLWDRYG
mgnify:CR=1 FL=1